MELPQKQDKRMHPDSSAAGKKIFVAESSYSVPSETRNQPSPNHRLFSGKALLVVCILLLLAFSAGYRYGQYTSNNTLDHLTVSAGMEITVHVKGAVVNPGLYSFSADQRVVDAVLAAKPYESADFEKINLAAYLEDGMEIIVPDQEAPSSVASPDDD